MARSFLRQTGRSEERSRAVVGYVTLALVPPLLTLLLLAGKFQGLAAVTALDHAQLARHVAGGEGFVTDFIRPLSLVFRADYRSHPDLYNAPAHPFVLALFYRLLHPSDKVTAGAGMALWILSVWLTFGVARRWLDDGTAALAALFYGCNVPTLAAALGGLPPPLMALFLLLAVWLAFPEEEELAENLPGWRIGLVGMTCALAVLTHYLLLTVAFALGVYLLVSQPQKKRVLVWFGFGFLLPLLPWMIRNFRVAGSPVCSLFWYEVLAHTRPYPGESVWRTAAPPLSPVFFISQHPLEILRKVLTNLTQFREAALDLVDPVIGLLFLMALLSQAESPGVAWLRAVVASSLGLFLAGSCLLQPDPLFLLAWEPLLAIIGAAHLSEWISERFPLIDLENGDLQAGGTFLDQPKISQWGRAGAYLVVVGLVIYPLFFFLAISRPGPAPLARGQVEPLKVLLPPQATVMTDQPALVAWYADRRAVWLCQRAEDWAGMERNVGPVDATYLTPAINQIDPEEQSDWWFWLASPEGIYRGLAPAKKRPPVGMLRVRRRDE